MGRDGVIIQKTWTFLGHLSNTYRYPTPFTPPSIHAYFIQKRKVTLNISLA